MIKTVTIMVDYKELLLTYCYKVEKEQDIDPRFYNPVVLYDIVKTYFKDKLNMYLTDESTDEIVEEINKIYFNFSLYCEHEFYYFYLIDNELYMLQM